MEIGAELVDPHGKSNYIELCAKSELKQFFRFGRRFLSSLNSFGDSFL